MRLFMLLVLIGIGGVSGLAWADLDEAHALYQNQNFTEALKLYRVAAKQGDATAQFNLGVMYANGDGVPEDDAKAVKWYRRAAEQGDADAQYNLARMYGGNGVAEDDAAAGKWLHRAAEQGHGYAQYSLGVMYAKGRGVPKDYIKAYAWLNLSAAQGIEDAKKNKDVLASFLTPKNIAEAQQLSNSLFQAIGESQ